MTSSFICLIYILIGTILATVAIGFFTKKEGLGIKLNLLVILVVSFTISVINYFFLGSVKNVSKSWTLSGIILICFCLLGISYQAVFGLVLNSSVLISFPANESVITGNIITLSVFWSFIL